MAQPTFRTDQAFVGLPPGPNENPPVVPSLKRRAIQALMNRCERCGSVKGVRQEPCRTMYTESKLNVSPFLCRECAEDYHDYWNSLWADYYSGLGV